MTKVNQVIIPHKMNQDVDERALKSNECRYKLNLRSGTTEGSNSEDSEPIGSTREIPNPFYNLGDVDNGSHEDISTSTVFFFVYNANKSFDKILRYTPAANKLERVLQHRYLNFRLDRKITDVDVVDGLLYWTDGGFVSFKDNDFTPPRKINIDKAIKFSREFFSMAMGNPNRQWEYNYCREAKSVTGQNDHYGKTAYIGVFPSLFSVGRYMVAWTLDGGEYGNRHKRTSGIGKILDQGSVGSLEYIVTDRPWREGPDITSLAKYGYSLIFQTGMYFGIDYQVLDAIKYPPAYPPSYGYWGSGSPKETGNLRDHVYQFCYRYIYDDRETTVLSAFSGVSEGGTSEMFDGSYIDGKENGIRITLDTGSIEVVAIELFFRTNETQEWKRFYRIEKYDQNGNVLIENDIPYVFEFFNNYVTQNLAKEDAIRPFDYVPQIARGQELIEKNRILYYDYWEGFDRVNPKISLTTVSRALSFADYQEAHDFYLADIIINNPDESLSREFLCIVVRLTDLMQRDRGLWYFSAFDENIIPDTISAIYMSSPGDYTANIISHWVDGIRLQYRTYPVFSKYNMPMLNDYTTRDMNGTTGNPLGQGILSGDRIAIAVNDYATPWPGLYGPKITESVSVGTTRKASLKHRSWYQAGVEYYDGPSRKGAVVLSENSRLYIPPGDAGDRAIDAVSLRMAIGHVPPMEADTYQVVISKRLSMSYFDYFRVYSIRETPAAVGIITMNTLDITVNPDILDMNEVFKKSIVKPYVWERGDKIRFAYYRTSQLANTQGLYYYKNFPDTLSFDIINAEYKEVPRQGRQVIPIYEENQKGETIWTAEGNKVENIFSLQITIPAFKYGSIDGFKDLAKIGPEEQIFVEIFRPKKENEDNLFYAIGPRIPISQPHTDYRAHQSTNSSQDDVDQTTVNGVSLNDAILTVSGGDVWVRNRLTGVIQNPVPFPIESTNYSDFYESELPCLGNVNVENRNMKRQNFPTAYRYSGLYIQDTQVNQLNSFSSGDSNILPHKFGRIAKMIEVGEVLRTLLQNKPISLYVSAVSMKQGTIGGQQVVALSDKVVGGQLIHPEDFGTINPESVTDSGSYTYFWDMYSGIWCRWSTNGVRQIVGKDSESGWDYGMSTYFRNKSRSLIKSGVANVNVYSAFESEYGNLIVTFVDHINPINNATLMFHEPTNSWTTCLSFIPDGYGTCNLVFMSSKGGRLYRHNIGVTDMDNAPNIFYGVQYKSEVIVVANVNPDKIKSWDSMEVFSYGNWESPETGDVYVITDGSHMRSRLKSSAFKRREGVGVVSFLRDMYTHGKESLSDLFNGRKLRGHTIRVRLISDDGKPIMGVNINGTISE